MPDPSAKKTTQHEIDFTKPVHISDTYHRPPRLSVAVREASVGTQDKYKTSVEKAKRIISLQEPAKFKENLGLFFTHLRERLVMGLEEAWASPWGYDGVPDESLEEKWARI